MMFKVSFAVALPEVAMPTTKVGNPAVLASPTAFSAFGESSGVPPAVGGTPMLPRPPAPPTPPRAAAPPAPVAVPQVGCPSVASSRNFGFGSVSVFMYVTAAFMAAVVGVSLDGWLPANAVWIFEPFIGPMGTMGVEVTPQLLSLAKKIMPQLTVVSVALTTVSMADET